MALSGTEQQRIQDEIDAAAPDDLALWRRVTLEELAVFRHMATYKLLHPKNGWKPTRRLKLSSGHRLRSWGRGLVSFSKAGSLGEPILRQVRFGHCLQIEICWLTHPEDAVCRRDEGLV